MSKELWTQESLQGLAGLRPTIACLLAFPSPAFFPSTLSLEILNLDFKEDLGRTLFRMAIFSKSFFETRVLWLSKVLPGLETWIIQVSHALGPSFSISEDQSLKGPVLKPSLDFRRIFEKKNFLGWAALRIGPGRTDALQALMTLLSWHAGLPPPGPSPEQPGHED